MVRENRPYFFEIVEGLNRGDIAIRIFFVTLTSK